jgi:hypothetical protein
MHFAELSESVFRFLRREFSQRGEGCQIGGVASFHNMPNEHIMHVFREAHVRPGCGKVAPASRRLSRGPSARRAPARRYSRRDGGVTPGLSCVCWFA